MSEHLPTREAKAIVYKIEGDQMDASAIGSRASWIIGRARVTARVDIDGTDYTWRVLDGRKYAIGDTITVTVPA